MRPFGALVFGRLGDMIGRKYTFLVTIMIMGMSTFMVGLLPTYASIGIAAPIILVALRLLQGLALGGEYGGAATYVAEHAPHGKRGCVHLVDPDHGDARPVPLADRHRRHASDSLGEPPSTTGAGACRSWLSFILLVVSVWIRLSLNESPAFKRMKEEGKTSKAPLTEALANWKNGKIVLLALFGLTAGQARGLVHGPVLCPVLPAPRTLKVDATTAQLMIGAALLLGTPFFIIFGSLSDKIGRKPIIMAGCLLAALTYFPLFNALTEAANPDARAAQAKNKVVGQRRSSAMLVPGQPDRAARSTSRRSCDIAKRYLAQNSVSYDNVDAPAGTRPPSRSATRSITARGHRRRPEVRRRQHRQDRRASRRRCGADLAAAGYPAKAKPIDAWGAQWWKIVGILFVLVVYVTMVYGPIAAMLVEMFPTRIRYTSMSLPYHIGNGWFGGLLPSIFFAIVASTGNMYNGLWYPIVIAAMTFVIGLLFIRETKDVDIYAQERARASLLSTRPVARAPALFFAAGGRCLRRRARRAARAGGSSAPCPSRFSAARRRRRSPSVP